MYPADVVASNKIVFAVSIMLLFIGFLIGLQPSVSEELIEWAEEQPAPPPKDFVGTTKHIFLNNLQVTVRAASVIYTLPTAVWSVGVVFGAVAAYFGLVNFISLMASFGLLELTAMLFATSTALLFIKWLLFKIFRKPSLECKLENTLILFACAVSLLVPSALIEALLIYTSTVSLTATLGATVLGATATTLLLYLVLLKKPD